MPLNIQIWSAGEADSSAFTALKIDVPVQTLTFDSMCQSHRMNHRFRLQDWLFAGRNSQFKHNLFLYAWFWSKLARTGHAGQTGLSWLTLTIHSSENLCRSHGRLLALCESNLVLQERLALAIQVQCLVVQAPALHNLSLNHSVELQHLFFGGALWRASYRIAWTYTSHISERQLLELAFLKVWIPGLF